MLLQSDLIPECWYIACTCTSCGQRLYITRDLTQGKGNLVGKFALTCPHCGHPGAFKAEHYYHPPNRNQPVTSPKNTSGPGGQASI